MRPAIFFRPVIPNYGSFLLKPQDMRRARKLHHPSISGATACSSCSSAEERHGYCSGSQVLLRGIGSVLHWSAQFGSHSSVLAALVAFLFAGTSFTVFALVIFFCPSVLGSLYRCFPQEVRLLPVGEDHMAFVVYIKIRCPVRVIPVFLVKAVFTALFCVSRLWGGPCLTEQKRARYAYVKEMVKRGKQEEMLCQRS